MAENTREGYPDVSLGALAEHLRAQYTDEMYASIGRAAGSLIAANERLGGSAITDLQVGEAMVHCQHSVAAVHTALTLIGSSRPHADAYVKSLGLGAFDPELDTNADDAAKIDTGKAIDLGELLRKRPIITEQILPLAEPTGEQLNQINERVTVRLTFAPRGSDRTDGQVKPLTARRCGGVARGLRPERGDVFAVEDFAHGGMASHVSLGHIDTGVRQSELEKKRNSGEISALAYARLTAMLHTVPTYYADMTLGELEAWEFEGKKVGHQAALDLKNGIESKEAKALQRDRDKSAAARIAGIALTMAAEGYRPRTGDEKPVLQVMVARSAAGKLLSSLQSMGLALEVRQITGF